VPIDREATLRQAEKLLRQGKLEGAIAEYVRLVQEQPRDWTSINALGDLYVRAGNRDRAVAQFTQVADFMFAEGFFPKASALYKKALKVVPDHEHTLLRLSEIASRQGLLADARHYLRQLDRLRRDRGDTRGAAEIVIRLALLDEADADARLAGARAAQAIGDTRQAVALFKAAAEELADRGRHGEALEALSAAAALDPSDHDLHRHLAREAVAAGEFARAQTFLTRESAGNDPDLLLALGRLELAAGREADARDAFTRLIAIAPERSGDLLDLARAFAREGALDDAFTCTRVLVDDALLAADWDRALGAVRLFLEHGPHIPALVMLVELAVDARRDDVMLDAQARLADAYLDAGLGAEARVIAEDLLARNPEVEDHAARLRRALGMLGVDDAEAVIGRYREPAADPGEGLDFDDLSFDLEVTADSSKPADLAPEVSEPSADSYLIDILEVDLSEALAGLGAASPILPPPPVTPTEEPVDPPADLESVFAEMRTRAAGREEGGDGGQHYERGLQQLEQGQIADALASLRAAARTPLYRFRAAARLGRLYVARGEAGEGIEWLERAAEAPPSSPDEGWAVLYDLGTVLERVGESARALAVFMELEADAASYQDVRARIEHLSRARAGKPCA
jgi:tetratricopeptide (TPR) repeat protein